MIFHLNTVPFFANPSDMFCRITMLQRVRSWVEKRNTAKRMAPLLRLCETKLLRMLNGDKEEVDRRINEELKRNIGMARYEAAKIVLDRVYLNQDYVVVDKRQRKK